MCTKFDVDSSSRFSCRARTPTETHRVIDDTDHSIHSSVIANLCYRGFGNNGVDIGGVGKITDFYTDRSIGATLLLHCRITSIAYCRKTTVCCLSVCLSRLCLYITSAGSSRRGQRTFWPFCPTAHTPVVTSSK